MNGHNNEYIVLFGNERHHPECHYKACKHKFDHLKDARKYAKLFYNAYIFKCHLNANFLMWAQAIY